MEVKDANRLIINNPLSTPVAIDAGTAENLTLQGQIDAKNIENGTFLALITANSESIAGLQGQLDYLNALSAPQVFALNRNLNNTLHNGLVRNLDQALLDSILNEDFDKHQINFLILGLEKEAIFLAKYEETGNEKFLIKAETEKAKFLAKVDSHIGNHDNVAGDAGGDVAGGGAAGDQAAKEAAAAAREAAKEAKAAAQEASQEAKDASKDAVAAARQAAKEAREAAKEAAAAARGNNG